MKDFANSAGKRIFEKTGGSALVCAVFLGGLSCAMLASVELRAQSAAPPPPPPPPAKSTRVRAKLDGFDIAPTSGKAPNQIGGASRDLGSLTLYAPKLGKAYTLTPTFYWSAEDEKAEFTFKLAALSTQESAIYVKKVTGGKFIYPADAPPLKPSETYVWSVQPENDLMGGMASASVLIVGGSNRDAIESALAGAKAGGEPSAAAAKVYVDNRLWFDAVAEYTALIEKHPEMPQYREERAELYDQLIETRPLADADVKVQH